MELEVILQTWARDPGCNSGSTDYFYAGEAALEDGLRVDLLLPDVYRDYVKRITARKVDEDRVEIKSEAYGDGSLSIEGDNCYSTGDIGLSYAVCNIDLQLVDAEPEDDDGRYDAWA